jgi:hypothetical protein
MPDAGFVFSPAFRVATDALEPVAGGTLEFYLAGTNTPTNVYSDSTLSTSLGSVVYLDSGGHPVASSGSSTKVIVYTGAALIKIIAKDADGATLATYDNVRCAQDTSALSGGGSDGGVESVVSKTADYTVLVADDGKLLHCDPTGGEITITLPSAATAADGFEISIRHAGTTTTNVVHITTVSSQTIARGSTTSAAVSIKRGGEVLRLVSNGANWVAYGDTAPDFVDSPIRITDRLTVPPTSPTTGARYLLNGSPTGDWASYAEHDIIEANGNGGWIRYRPYTDCGWLAYVVDEDLLVQYRGTAWVDLDNITGPTSSDLRRAFFSEQQAVNTSPTALTTSAWTKSHLNTTGFNTITGASLASSVITLPAGTFLIKGYRSFYFTGGGSSSATAKLRLQDTTNSLSYYGTNEFDQNSTASTVATTKNVPFFFTVTNAAQTTYELQYYIASSNYTGGLPANIGSTPEIYTQVEILDLSSLQGPPGPQGLNGSGIVSVQDYGAAGDGVADDTAEIQAALDATDGATCFFPDGTYLVSSPLIIPRNCAVLMASNAEIRATAAMEAVFMTNAADEHLNNVIHGGYIDCNDLADSGIWVKWFSMFRIEDVEIWDNNDYGIRLGRTAGTSSYEAFIQDVRIRRSLVAAPAGSYGIYFEHAGDSHIVQTIIMGQVYGVGGVSINDSKFDRVHVWNPQENGACETAFAISGTDNILTQCQVDGDVSFAAYYLNGPRNVLLGCSTNHVSWGTDNVAECVNVAASSHAVVMGCTWKGYSGSVRWAADYVLGSGSTIDYVGNKATHVVTTHNQQLSSTFEVNKAGQAADAAFNLVADAGQAAFHALKTGDEFRWAIVKGSTAESGSNAGSDFAINRYDDDGNYLGTSIAISRATGRATLESPMQLPVYTVAALPTGAAGLTAYASNGRKNGEGGGSGTGVMVFHDGTAWRACDTGATVAA